MSLANALIPTEDQEQIAVVQYCILKGYPHWHTPNSTFTKSWKQKTKNKAMGVSPGVPDLGVIVNNRLIFIEMKRVKGGSLSEHQKLWIANLERAKVPVRVCKGFKEAKAFIDEIAKL